MGLNNYNFYVGSKPTELLPPSTYTISGDIRGLTTYDQTISGYRPLLSYEIPVDENGFINIVQPTSSNPQTKIELLSQINPQQRPYEDSTIIISGKIKSLPTSGYTIVSDQITNYFYSWKLIIFPDKIEFRKQDFQSGTNSTNFNWSKDKYISIEYPHSLNIGDEVIFIIRTHTDQYNDPAIDSKTFLDMKLGTTLSPKLEMYQTKDLITNNILLFYDFDDRYPNDFLLRGSIIIPEMLDDSEVNDILTDSSELDSIIDSSSDIEQINELQKVIKFKTVTIPNGTTGSISIIEDSEVNGKVYIHGVQMRVIGIPGTPIGDGVYLENTGGFLYAHFTDVIPPEGYWTLNTIHIVNGIAPGFNEDGGTTNEGVIVRNPITNFTNDVKFTVWYSIE